VNSRLSPADAGSATDWVAELSPWPEEFGLDRMHRLLDRLGHPERRYAAIHVVGTNGKSTATRTIATLLRAEGRRAGAYTSPHVSGWAERIWVDGAEADFERAVARIRADAEAVGATQFEALTIAALMEFAEQQVDVAVVEAGLGGRLDATNVVDARVVLLTNVSLEHTEVLGTTREEIAREKLAVAHTANVVVLPDDEYAHLVPKSADCVTGGAREAAEAFLGRPLKRDVHVALPGRFEIKSDSPLEIWDGAHNLEAVCWLTRELAARNLERKQFVLVVSILADKDAEKMLMRLYPIKRVVTTQSSNPRAWSADELARIAADLGDNHRFSSIEAIPDPHEALARARTLAGRDGALLVTGSLYLLADLAADRS
jgi:dihydrofolate synthase / folylpolyglutamate synthase